MPVGGALMPMLVL